VRHSGWKVTSPKRNFGLVDNFSGAYTLATLQNNFQNKDTFSLSHFLIILKKNEKMTKKKLEMDIINSHCAGFDIGSRSHFVAVGQALRRCKGIWGVC